MPTMRLILTLLTTTVALTACSSTPDDGRDEIGAGVMCEQFIEERLVSPGSAEFQPAGEYVVSGSGSEYVVSGHVDSDNAFGASLRSDFVCTIRDNGDDSWTLVDLTGLG